MIRINLLGRYTLHIGSAISDVIVGVATIVGLLSAQFKFYFCPGIPIGTWIGSER